jgi:hypothetical protein
MAVPSNIPAYFLILSSNRIVLGCNLQHLDRLQCNLLCSKSHQGGRFSFIHRRLIRTLLSDLQKLKNKNRKMV